MWTSDAMTNSVCGAGQQDGCGGGDGAAGGHSRHSSLCGQPVREPGYQTATHGVCSSGTSKCHLQSFIVRCHYSDGWLCPAEVYPADENGTCKVVCHYGRWNGGAGGALGSGGGVQCNDICVTSENDTNSNSQCLCLCLHRPKM